MAKKEEFPEGEYGKIFAEWDFPEYQQYKRTGVWYFWYIVISVAFLIFAIFTANPLFAIIIVMVDVIIFFQGKKDPHQIHFQITEDGIILDKKLYTYSRIENFWVIYNPPEVKELFFEFKSAIRPELAVPLQDNNPVRIREFLLQYLEEDLTKEHEGFSRGLRRTLKF